MAGQLTGRLRERKAFPARRDDPNQQDHPPHFLPQHHELSDHKKAFDVSWISPIVAYPGCSWAFAPSRLAVCTRDMNPSAGEARRNQFRGPEFVWSDMYLTKRIPLREKLAMRLEAQFFNVFNHPNFGLPSMVLAGVPGKSSTQTGFGALTYTTSPPTGLLGVGLGGDSSPRMIAVQLKLEF